MHLPLATFITRTRHFWIRSWCKVIWLSRETANPDPTYDTSVAVNTTAWSTKGKETQRTTTVFYEDSAQTAHWSKWRDYKTMGHWLHQIHIVIGYIGYLYIRLYVIGPQWTNDTSNIASWWTVMMKPSHSAYPDLFKWYIWITQNNRNILDRKIYIHKHKNIQKRTKTNIQNILNKTTTKYLVIQLVHFKDRKLWD